MLTFSPVWATEFTILYFGASCLTLVLCLVVGIAIYRTKKTPYPTRLLCIGLLCYNGMFLSCSSAAKLFPHEETFLLRHLSRGFQTAAQIIVAFMAFERYFVLNWPYKYLRMPNRLVRKVCIGIIVLSFLQYALIRGFGCYASGMYLNCRLGSIYFPVVSALVLFSSFAVYAQIYSVIRRKALDMKQYRGTIASFMYLVNCSFFLGLYLGLSVYNTLLRTKDETPTGWVGQMADVAYLANCFIDPLIYGMWFEEVRFEILKTIAYMLPQLKPYVEKRRIEVFVVV